MFQFHADRARPQDSFADIQRAGNQIPRANSFQLQLDFAGLQPGHFRGFSHQTIQPVALFINDMQQFVPLAAIELCGRKQRGY